MTPKNLLIAAALAAAVLIGYWLFFAPESSPPESDAAATGQSAEASLLGSVVRISPAQIKTASISLDEVGAAAPGELILSATVNATPSGLARVDARAGGVVRSISKGLGDYVTRGATLARIESAEAASLAAALSAARARTVELQSAYAREKQLFEANVTARQDLEAAQANLSVARSELSRAQAAVAAAGVSGDGRSLAVTSPLNGRITAAPAVLGSYVAAGDEMFRVVNPNSLQIEVAIPAAEAARIAVGDEAIVAVPGGGEVGARVRSVTPLLDPESRSAVALLSLRRAVPGLQPGAFVETRIRPSRGSGTEGYSVSEEAVQTVEGQDVVFVHVAKGFRVQPVRIGARSGGRIAILSGLKGDETVAGKNAFLIKAEIAKQGEEDE